MLSIGVYDYTLRIDLASCYSPEILMLKYVVMVVVGGCKYEVDGKHLKR